VSSKNIYANTISELESTRLLGIDNLKKITALPFEDAIKRLTLYGFFERFDTDIDTLIEKQLNNLIEFIDNYCQSDYLKQLLINYIWLDDITAANDTPNHPKQDIFNQNLSLANKIDKKFVQFIKTQIDIENLLLIHRIKNTNLEMPLFEGGNISTENFDVKNTHLEDLDKLLQIKNYAEFRKVSNELLLLNILKINQTNFSTFAPFVKYFFNKLFEIKDIRFILICLKNGINTDTNYFWSISNV